MITKAGQLEIKQLQKEATQQLKTKKKHNWGRGHQRREQPGKNTSLQRREVKERRKQKDSGERGGRRKR